MVKGRVRNLTNYGAFIEIEEGIDGLLHVSDMSWTRKISHPSELVEKGKSIECKVISVDQERRRIALGLKQLDGRSLGDRHPQPLSARPTGEGQSHEDHQLRRLCRLEDGLEGLLHISELADQVQNENPQDVVMWGTRSKENPSRRTLADAKSDCPANGSSGLRKTKRPPKLPKLKGWVEQTQTLS